MLRWHWVQVAAPEYWLRGGLPFVGHHPGSPSRSVVVRLVSFAGGACARARQNVIPANDNMIRGSLLKAPPPFQSQFGGFSLCDGDCRDVMAGENHEFLQLVDLGDQVAHCRSVIAGSSRRIMVLTGLYAFTITIPLAYTPRCEGWKNAIRSPRDPESDWAPSFCLRRRRGGQEE